MNIFKLGALLVALCLFKPSFAAELTPLTPNCSSSHAVVLVGGFKDDWRYFAPWVEAASQTGCVYGFVANYHKLTMTEAADVLATELNEQVLSHHQSLTILAHSMGGLVMRRALYDVNFTDQDVQVHAYGTPWGGYGFANPVNAIPGMQAIMSFVGMPMSGEMGNQSPFMEYLRAPVPANIQMSIYASVDDFIGAPSGAASVRQFEAVTAQANFSQFAELGHFGFVSSLRNPL